MILIGSKAIKHWFPDFHRNPKDEDYIGEGKSKKGIEYLPNPIFNNYVGEILLPNDLYTLKISHTVGWDINWMKHVFDIQFMKKKGCQLNKELFNKLYEYWNQIHGKNKRSDLEMTSEDFFDNAITCEYSHDWLHTLINPYPTYNKILKDGAEVDVDESKFNKLTFEEKCDLVREEVYIMAYERYEKLGYLHAYDRMLKKFILNHAPIWEAIFIVENHIHLYKPKINFIKTIKNKINENIK